MSIKFKVITKFTDCGLSAGVTLMLAGSIATAQTAPITYEHNGMAITYSQNDAGSAMTVQDARGVTTTFQANQLGLLTSEQSAERGLTQYIYDEVGNVITEITEGGLIFKRDYDDQNRLMREAAKENGVDRKVTRYSYDDCKNGLGKICKINSNGTVTRYEYNVAGKFTKIATKYAGEDKFETTHYIYSEDGLLERLRYPTGLVIRYHYTDDGFITRVTGRYEIGEDKSKFTIAHNIRFNPKTGNVTKLKFGNGLKLQRSFDDSQRIEKYELSQGNTPLKSSIYERDEAGNVTAIARLNSDESVRYGYDEQQRLIFEQKGTDLASQKTISYGYDAVNNRTRREIDAQFKSYHYAPMANRLDAVNRKTFTYDVRGNLIHDAKGKRRFDYDVNNRMMAFFKDGKLKASYDYNAFGQRIRKTVRKPSENENSYKTLHFAYAPNGALLSEFGRNSDKQRRFARDYVWLGAMPLAQIERKVRPDGTTRSAKISYIHTDHLSAPYAASNDNGEIVWQWNRDAFGQGQADRDVDGDGENTVIRLRFPGQYFDRESGLFYNHFRDYDPKLGRYIQSDPIGLRGGINRYAYVAGNPVNYIDPKGLELQLSFSTSCFVYVIVDADGNEIPGSASAPICSVTSDAGGGAGNNGFSDGPVGIGGDGVVKIASNSPVKIPTCIANRLRHEAALDDCLARFVAAGSRVTRNVSFRDPSQGNIRVVADAVISSGSPVGAPLLTMPQIVIDIKTGNGGFTPNQTLVYPRFGTDFLLVPVGLRAFQAGFTPGVPINVKQITLEIPRYDANGNRCE